MSTGNTLKITSKIDLDTTDAKKALNNFVTYAKNNQEVIIKGKFEMENNTQQTTKAQQQLIAQYKDTYNAIEKIKNKMSKGFDDINAESSIASISQLEGKLNTLYASISDVNKLELFEFKQANSDIVKIESGLQQLTSRAETLSKGFSDIRLIDINADGLSQEINAITDRIEELRRISSTETNYQIDFGMVNNEITELTTKLNNLREVENLESVFKGIQHSMENALGTQQVSEFEARLTALRGEASNLDGNFNKLFANLKSDISTASGDVRGFESELSGVEKALDKLEGKSEKVFKQFNSIDFKNIDTSDMVSDLTRIEEKLELLRKQAQNGIDVQVEIGDATRELSELETKVKNMKVADALISDFNKLESTIRDTFDGNEIDAFRSDLARLESEVNSVDGSFDRLASEIRSSMNDARSSVDTTTRSINDMGTATRTSNSFMNEFSSNFSQFTLANIASDAIINGVRGMTSAFMDLDSAMTNIRKVADPSDIASVGQLDEIQNKAIEVAKQVGQTSADVMETIANTIQAGLGESMQDAIDIAEQVMMLANVGELSANEASSAVNTMVNGFNVDPVNKFTVAINGVDTEVTELTLSMDAINHASNNFGASTGQLMTGMQSGATVLGSYGVTLDETIALMTTGIEVLGDGAKVGNGLKSIGVNLNGIKASADDGSLSLNKTAKALQEVAGIDVYSDKTAGEMKGMTAILEEVAAIWDDLTGEERSGLAEAIAGKEQAAVFNALMVNLDTYESMLDQFASKDHYGSMVAENAQYVDSVAGKLNHLREIWISIGTTIVDSSFVKSVIDVFITLSECIETVIKTLDKMDIGGLSLFPPLILGIIGGFRGLASETNLVTTAINTLSGNGAGLSTVMGGATTALKTFVTNGLLIAGVTLAVGALIKAWDEHTNGLENNRTKLLEIAEGHKSEIKTQEQKLSALETTGRAYEDLAKKANKTVEEEEEMLRLGNELALVLPQIRIGTDEDGNAIISMTQNMDGYVEITKQAIEQQERLLALNSKDLIENTFKQLNEGEKWGNSFDSQIDIIQSSYNNKINSVRDTANKALAEISSTSGKTQEKAIETFKATFGHLEKHERDARESLLEANNNILQAQSDFFNGYSAIWKDSANRLAVELTPELTNAVEGFARALDFTEIDTTFEMAEVERIFRELPRLAQQGTVDFESVTERIAKFNSELNQTGNMDGYQLSMKTLSEEISNASGWDVDVLYEMFTKLELHTLKGSSSLDDFLGSFNKTMTDLRNGDGMSKALQEQYDAMVSWTDKMQMHDFTIESNAILVTELISDDSLPEQIRDFARSLSNAGIDDLDVITLTTEVIMDYQDNGSIDNLDEIKARVETHLEHLVDSVDDPEFKLSPIIHLEGLDDKNNIKKELDDAFGDKDFNIGVTIDGVEKAKTEVKELTDEVDKATTTGATITVETEGTEKATDEIKGIGEEVDKVNTTGATVTVESEGVEETKADLKEIEESQDKVSTPTNLTINNGELQGSVETFAQLVEYSTKLEDGIYSITFKSDTVDAIAQIDNLTKSVNDLSNKFASIPAVSVSIDTTAAQSNMASLTTKVDEFIATASGVGTVTFTTETALASKNVTGLKENVADYNSKYAGKNFSTLFNTQTAQASQNMSGLKSNVEDYVRRYAGKTFTTTFAINRTTTETKQVFTMPTITRSIDTYEDSMVNRNITIQDNVNTITDTSSINDSAYNVSPRYTSNLTNYQAFESIKHELNAFEDLEIAIQKVNDEMSIFDELSKNAWGDTKIGYLNEQIKLLQKQSSLQKANNKDLDTYRNELEYMLARNGVQFIDEEIVNYQAKYLEFEKQIVALQKQKDGAETEFAKSQLDEQIDKYSNLQSMMEDYKKSSSDMSSVQSAIISTTNEIKELEKAIREAKIEADNFEINVQIGQVESGLGVLSNQMALLDAQLDNVYGGNKEVYIKQKLDLIRKEQDEVHKLANAYREQAEYYGKMLNNFGFAFDGNTGEILNLSQLDLYKEADIYEEIVGYVEEYYKLSQDSIPGLSVEWWKLQNEIKNTKDELQDLIDASKNFELNLNIGKVEMELDSLSTQLDFLDAKLDNVYGKDREDVIRQKLELIKQEQEEVHNLANAYREQAKVYGQSLNDLGFMFSGSTGEILNLEQLDLYKDKSNFEDVVKLIEQYYKISQKSIPELSTEWWKLQSAISDTKDELKDLIDEAKNFELNLNIGSAQNNLSSVRNELDKLQIQIDRVEDGEKEALINERIELLKKEQEELVKLTEAYKAQAAVFGKELNNLGFVIDGANGKILNLDHLEVFKDTENYEKVVELLEKYFDLSQNTIPGLTNDWWALENSIDASRESIEELAKAAEKALKDVAEFIKNIHFKYASAEIDKVSSKIDEIESKLKKTDALNSQLSLYAQKQDLLEQEKESVASLLGMYEREALLKKNYLTEQGFLFRQDGTIANLGHLESFIGKDILGDIKDAITEFTDITTSEIPSLQSDFNALNDELWEVSEAIEEAIKSHKRLIAEARYDEIADGLRDVNHELSIVNKQLDHATGMHKVSLLEKQVDLLERQKEELAKQHEFLQGNHVVLQMELKQYGFEFDASGDITNYAKQLEELSLNHDNFKDIQEILEDYFKLQNDELPSLKEQWYDVENALKSALKEQLQITKTAQDQITAVYKAQVEERKKLIDEELNARLTALDKEKQAYLDSRNEQKYQDNYDDQLKQVMEIQRQVEIASRDTSLAGQKKYQELLAQLREEQDKLQDIVQDKIDSDILSKFDEEKDRLETQANSEKNDLDDKYSDENIYDIVNQVLDTGIFTDIDGQLHSINDVMLNYIDKYEEGMSAVGSIIKDEWLTNLDIARDVMRDMAGIIDSLDSSNVVFEVNSRSIAVQDEAQAVASYSGNTTNSSTLNITSPLIVVEGNIDSSVMTDFEEVCEYVTNKIVSEYR